MAMEVFTPIDMTSPRDIKEKQYWRGVTGSKYKHRATGRGLRGRRTKRDEGRELEGEFKKAK